MAKNICEQYWSFNLVQPRKLNLEGLQSLFQNNGREVNVEKPK